MTAITVPAQIVPTVPGSRTRVEVALVVLGSLAVASFGSWVPGLWWDETATLTGATRTVPELWAEVGTVDAVHGLYYAGMHLWVEVAGTSAFALRFPSAVAAAVACLGTWWIGDRLHGRSLARVAAVVFALLPRVTWFGAEGRSYAFTAAVAVWTTVLLRRALQRRRRTWPTWCGYAALATLGVVLDVYLVLLLVAHLATLLWLARGRRRQIGAAWAAAALAPLVAWLPVVRLAAGQSAELPEASVGLTGYVRLVLVEQYFTGALPVLRQVMSLDSAWAGAALCLAALGWALAGLALARARSGPGRDVLAVVVPWIVLPLGAVALGAVVVDPSLYAARYLSFTTPALALLVGLGLLAIRRARVRLLVGVLAVALVVPVYASQRTATAKHGYDWAAAATYVRTHAEAGQTVWFSPAEGSAIDAYPAAFAGLRDPGLEASAGASGTLFGVRRTLASTADVPEVDVLWVVETTDTVAARATVARDESLVVAAGFVETSRWQGTQTVVVSYRRAASATRLEFSPSVWHAVPVAR